MKKTRFGRLLTVVPIRVLLTCSLFACGGFTVIQGPAAAASSERSLSGGAGAGSTSFQVQGAGAAFDTSLPPSSVATYVWKPGGQDVQEWLTSTNGTSLANTVTQQHAIAMGGGPE